MGKPGRREGKARDPFRARGAEPLQSWKIHQRLISDRKPICAPSKIGTARERNSLTGIPPHLRVEAFHTRHRDSREHQRQRFSPGPSPWLR
jgi:hypothetical protein